MNVTKNFMAMLLAFTLINCTSERSQTIYNLEFEDKIPNLHPRIWDSNHSHDCEYEVIVDGKERQSGDYSLKLAQTGANKDSWVFIANDIPIEPTSENRDVEVKCWVKVKDVDNGFVSLWISDDTEGNIEVTTIDNSYQTIVNGTTEWIELSAIKNISKDAREVNIRVTLKGGGTAWLDNFKIMLDGEEIRDTPIPKQKTHLTEEDKRGLEKYIYPLQSCEPNSTSFDDLEVLSELVGDSKVIALGEVTHGSSEIFKMKDRIVRYLATNEDFDIFSIEAGMPESYKLNEYIVDGESNARELISGMIFWIWNTYEMLNVVEWMRNFNQDEPKITYTGFDMQSYNGAITTLKEAFSGDREVGSLLENINIGLDSVLTYTPTSHAKIEETTSSSIKVELEELKYYIEESAFETQEKSWLLQNITIINQFLGQGTYSWRERCMADNILWINRLNPLSRMIVWAHNSHIKKSGGSMGKYLKDSLGDDYVTVGFTFYDGNYSATGWGDKNHQAYPGTLEHLLEQLNHYAFILDLKKIRLENNPIVKWIDNVNFRQVGALRKDNEFNSTKVTEDFDYLIFIRYSNPSKLLNAIPSK